ncbi:hypothetical protein FACS1894103_1600 [Campylobacterota bacterium]|nr:hypothetical protein FACS1894103_1600 [Campylobacterota bacterium]
MTNIDKFDHFTGLIFAKLYKSFPVYQNINIVGFLESDYKAIIESSGGNFEVEKDRMDSLVLSETLFWLRDSGFIDFVFPPKKSMAGRDIVPSSEFLGTTLTAKGLETLKRTPKTVNGAKSLGEAFIGTAKELSLDSVKMLVSEALGVGASILVKWGV